MDTAPDVIYAKDTEDRNEDSQPQLSPTGHLNYIGVDCESITDAVSKVNGNLVRRLDLSFNLIKTLHGLGSCPNIEELILDNNDLSDDLDFPTLPRLHTLMLNKNNIQTLGEFLDKVERHLPALTYLSLLGNEACPNQLSDKEKGDEDYKRYRHYVLFRLPNLKFLDSSPVKDSERRAAKQIEEQLEAIRKVKAAPGISVEDEPESPSIYTPLPSGSGGSREGPGQKATFGKCKYVYYGKHSEGNRFIRNNDL